MSNIHGDDLPVASRKRCGTAKSSPPTKRGGPHEWQSRLGAAREKSFGRPCPANWLYIFNIRWGNASLEKWDFPRRHIPTVLSVCSHPRFSDRINGGILSGVGKCITINNNANILFYL